MMRYLKRIFPVIFTLCLAAGLFSCYDDNRSEITFITVASRKVICTTVSDGECYVIKPDGSGTWRRLDFPIFDFDYEPGYEYYLQVKLVHVKNPGINEPVKKYFCQQVISKERADSNIPYARCDRY